ncbi:HEAT repeat domain-containing protein [Nocardia thailandica]
MTTSIKPEDTMDDDRDKILAALSTGDATQQVQALIQLIKNADRQALPLVLDKFGSDDEMVRSEAARAAGFLGADQIELVGPGLLVLLNDDDELVRNEAAESLAKLYYPPAGPPLAERLHNDPEWIVRASAAEALGLYPQISIPALTACALDIDELDEVRRYALHSIGRSAGYIARDTIDTLVRKLGDDPDLGLSTRLAAYRLGLADQLDTIEVWTPTLDELQASLLLNELNVMTEPPRPPTLHADSNRITALIDTVALRWPSERNHADNVRRKYSDS